MTLSGHRGPWLFPTQSGGAASGHPRLDPQWD